MVEQEGGSGRPTTEKHALSAGRLVSNRTSERLLNFYDADDRAVGGFVDREFKAMHNLDQVTKLILICLIQF